MNANKGNRLRYLAAIEYIKSGLEVIPNHPTEKYPVGFTNWQNYTFSEKELEHYILKKGWNLGVRNIEGLDIDNNGYPDAKTILKEWASFVAEERSGLLKRLLVERTPNKGFHVVWKCSFVGNSQKLANRPPLKAELIDDKNIKSVVLIETKGKSGQFVVSPSIGYEMIQGDWKHLETITPKERKTLIHCAKLFDRTPTYIEGVQPNY